ncbi:uncharacterized protein LOC111432120 [Cucurbita moschata]|uniref:Uncharacterized protein LOC111432120 n=1 Tax=Cucurbita moschata TaxID=3662 RepID=A0A6J1E9Q1_CUCMO|nr:uncharacterized protein LOC111432120 [Cucurbita moschata]
MEFSSFCSGTERAVKDLAGRLRLPRRGIMTAELLEILYKEKRTESPGSDAKTDEKGNIPTDQKVCFITFYSIYLMLNQNQVTDLLGVLSLYVFLVDRSIWYLVFSVHMLNGNCLSLYDLVEEYI